ncbi:hypothetical protein BC643_0377 [Mangrovibacterium diazotrophicum]|uniref:Uncharacterized protein n=1 Tax=Mangrovibacterium diazotrophicum TaxID=1261403 RepID=A0A419W3H9_9BACT|nr:hypothetical protein BC643_0377 [Mangrovibacterium diazotrophicum]
MLIIILFFVFYVYLFFSKLPYLALSSTVLNMFLAKRIKELREGKD